MGPRWQHHTTYGPGATDKQDAGEAFGQGVHVLHEFVRNGVPEVEGLFPPKSATSHTNTDTQAHVQSNGKVGDDEVGVGAALRHKAVQVDGGGQPVVRRV